jgi:hypothetical protein
MGSGMVAWGYEGGGLGLGGYVGYGSCSRRGGPALAFRDSALSRLNSIGFLGFTTTARRRGTSHTSLAHQTDRRRRFPFYSCINPSAGWFGRLIPRILFPTGSDRVGSGRVGVFDVFIGIWFGLRLGWINHVGHFSASWFAWKVFFGGGGSWTP